MDVYRPARPGKARAVRRISPAYPGRPGNVMVYVRLDISEARQSSDMTNDELRESMEQARALTSMHPPRNVALVLEQYKRELLKEINNRPDVKVSENTERQPVELTDADIAAPDNHATVRSEEHTSEL